MIRSFTRLFLLVAITLSPAAIRGQENIPPVQLEFFEKKIRPILVQKGGHPGGHPGDTHPSRPPSFSPGHGKRSRNWMGVPRTIFGWVSPGQFLPGARPWKVRAVHRADLQEHVLGHRIVGANPTTSARYDEKETRWA